MFDGLGVKTTLNDLYDGGVKDDRFAIIYDYMKTTIYLSKLPWDYQKEDQLILR